MDRGARWATVQRVTESDTTERLSLSRLENSRPFALGAHSGRAHSSWFGAEGRILELRKRVSKVGWSRQGGESKDGFMVDGDKNLEEIHLVALGMTIP